MQVHLLPMAGPGEARRLTDLPRGVEAFEWSPDGKSLAVLSSSMGAGSRVRRASAAQGARREARHAARERLPLCRSAALPGERPRLHRASPAPGLARRRSHGDGAAAHQPPGRGQPGGLEPGRNPARDRDRPQPRRRPVLPATDRRPRRHDGPIGVRRRALSRRLRRPGLAPGRPLDRGPGRPPAAPAVSIRHLDLPGRRIRSTWRPRPVGPARHHAGLVREQRRDHRRGRPPPSRGGWRLDPLPRADSRLERAVADRDRRRRHRAPDRGSPLPVELRRRRGRIGNELPRASPRSARQEWTCRRWSPSSRPRRVAQPQRTSRARSRARTAR